MSFTLEASNAVVETFYLDVDDNGKLSLHDVEIGGDGSTTVGGKCYGGIGKMDTTRDIDWTVDLLDKYGGPVDWNGDDQDY
ncbi:MAG TPA: hypothetical protein VF678_09050 [bacterium]